MKDFTEDELTELYKTIGLGALKFFLLRVDPKKKMVFNPEESIDFHGFTGPFVQYTYARIKSVLRKVNSQWAMGNGEEKFTDNRQPAIDENDSSVNEHLPSVNSNLLLLEKEIIVQLEQFPSIIEEAATFFDPSKIAIYVYDLSKAFSSFYTEHSIANAESEEKKQLRLMIAQQTANVIKTAMNLLGIKVPERM